MGKNYRRRITVDPQVYRKLLSVRGQQVAVEYMGEVPEDLAVVL